MSTTDEKRCSCHGCETTRQVAAAVTELAAERTARAKAEAERDALRRDIDKLIDGGLIAEKYAAEARAAAAEGREAALRERLRDAEHNHESGWCPTKARLAEVEKERDSYRKLWLDVCELAVAAERRAATVWNEAVDRALSKPETSPAPQHDREWAKAVYQREPPSNLQGEKHADETDTSLEPASVGAAGGARASAPSVQRGEGPDVGRGRQERGGSDDLAGRSRGGDRGTADRDEEGVVSAPVAAAPAEAVADRAPPRSGCGKELPVFTRKRMPTCGDTILCFACRAAPVLGEAPRPATDGDHMVAQAYLSAQGMPHTKPPHEDAIGARPVSLTTAEEHRDCLASSCCARSNFWMPHSAAARAGKERQKIMAECAAYLAARPTPASPAPASLRPCAHENLIKNVTVRASFCAACDALVATARPPDWRATASPRADEDEPWECRRCHTTPNLGDGLEIPGHRLCWECASTVLDDVLSGSASITEVNALAAAPASPTTPPRDVRPGNEQREQAARLMAEQDREALVDSLKDWPEAETEQNANFYAGWLVTAVRAYEHLAAAPLSVPRGLSEERLDEIVTKWTDHAALYAGLGFANRPPTDVAREHIRLAIRAAVAEATSPASVPPSKGCVHNTRGSHDCRDIACQCSPLMHETGACQCHRRAMEEDAYSRREAGAASVPVPLSVRPEVLAFAEAMEAKLRRHDGSRGNQWRVMSAEQLLARLDEEVAELKVAVTTVVNVRREYDPRDRRYLPQVEAEAADVGNLAMMVADMLRHTAALLVAERKPPGTP